MISPHGCTYLASAHAASDTLHVEEADSHMPRQLTGSWEKNLTDHPLQVLALRWSIPVQTTWTLNWQHVCRQSWKRTTSRELSGWPAQRTHCPPKWGYPKAVKRKHPPPHPDSSIPSADQTSQHLTIPEEDVMMKSWFCHWKFWLVLADAHVIFIRTLHQVKRGAHCYNAMSKKQSHMRHTP